MLATGIGDQLQDRSAVVAVKAFAGSRTEAVDPDAGVHRGQMLVDILGIECPEIRTLAPTWIGDLDELARLYHPRPAVTWLNEMGIHRRQRELPLAVKIDLERHDAAHLHVLSQHGIYGMPSA